MARTQFLELKVWDNNILGLEIQGQMMEEQPDPRSRVGHSGLFQRKNKIAVRAKRR